ncbi:hypothetical protein [Longimicrobium sp.]|uniref:hypothetical protein n=1 Tax=Longimicrobium sp. TaxID=2029185 RepID=UPI002E33F071|nr:hypothetical protein [Longimicrobium sp.]HEX6041087.1 hypothetical protein [Longimicrobium sp.]
MPYSMDRAVSRHGRDRDLFADGPRLGPYEAPYDTRRGYDQPLRRVTRDEREVATILFMGREDRLTDGAGE